MACVCSAAVATFILQFPGYVIGMLANAESQGISDTVIADSQGCDLKNLFGNSLFDIQLVKGCGDGC